MVPCFGRCDQVVPAEWCSLLVLLTIGTHSVKVDLASSSSGSSDVIVIPAAVMPASAFIIVRSLGVGRAHPVCMYGNGTSSTSWICRSTNNPLPPRALNKCERKECAKSLRDSVVPVVEQNPSNSSSLDALTTWHRERRRHGKIGPRCMFSCCMYRAPNRCTESIFCTRRRLSG
jgi:hypothetical protein